MRSFGTARRHEIELVRAGVRRCAGRPPDGNCSNCDGDQVVQGSGTGSGAKGGIFINSKWAYNVTGAYQIPVIETSLGFNLTGRQGYPIPYIARVSTSEGSQPVLISDEIDNHRLPNITVLDLRLAKDVRLGPVGLTVSADVFNVFNTAYADEVQQRVPARSIEGFDVLFESPTSIEYPRQLTLGARWSF